MSMLGSTKTGSNLKSIPMLKLFSQLINECSKLTSGTRLWFESPLLMQSLVWAVGSAARGSVHALLIPSKPHPNSGRNSI